MHVPVDSRPAIELRVDVREERGRQSRRHDTLYCLIKQVREEHFVNVEGQRG